MPASYNKDTVRHVQEKRDECVQKDAARADVCLQKDAALREERDECLQKDAARADEDERRVISAEVGPSNPLINRCKA